MAEGKESKPSKITVLSRSYYKRGWRSGGNWTTEVCVYKNLTPKKLENLLLEKNKGLRTNLWVVKGQYNLAKKSDQEAYFKYCLSCFYDPNTYDHVSAGVGHKMVQALSENFDGLKGAEEKVWDFWFYKV